MALQIGNNRLRANLQPPGLAHGCPPPGVRSLTPKVNETTGISRSARPPAPDRPWPSRPWRGRFGARRHGRLHGIGQTKAIVKRGGGGAPKSGAAGGASPPSATTMWRL